MISRTPPFSATPAVLGDTDHLRATELGAYLLLLAAMWRNNGQLPNNPNLLARYTRMTTTKLQQVWPSLAPYFQITQNSLTHARLALEIERRKKFSAKQSNNAKVRWLKPKDTYFASALPDHVRHLYDDVCKAVGFSSDGLTPEGWADISAVYHVASWRGLGLTDFDIVAIARKSRASFACTMPQGPADLDPIMRQMAVGRSQHNKTRDLDRKGAR